MTPILTKILSVVLTPFLFTSSFFSGLVHQAPSLTLGASIPQGVAVFETSLLSAITSSATTMTLTTNSVRGGSTLSGFNCFTVDEGKAEREDICGIVSGTTVSSLTRGIDPVTATSTNATLQFAHRRGAQVKITDFPLLQIIRNQLNGLETLPNAIKYATGVAPSGNGDLVDLEYVSGLAFNGIITGANFPISNTLVYYNGTNLVSTSTRPLYVDAISATSTTASSSIALAVGISTTTPHSKLTVANNGSILVTENRLSTSTSMTIDWRQGNTQLLQLGVAATSISHSGQYPGGQMKVVVCNPGTTAGAITWSGVDWVGGSAPSQSTTANFCDVWSFLATTATSTTGTGVKIFGAVTNGFQ